METFCLNVHTNTDIVYVSKLLVQTTIYIEHLTIYIYINSNSNSMYIVHLTISHMRMSQVTKSL